MLAKTRSQKARILSALAIGPSTSNELAAEIGIAVKSCSALLVMLAKSGRVVKIGTEFVRPCEHCGHKKAGNPGFIYSLVKT